MSATAATSSTASTTPISDAEVFGIERPHSKLWIYYFLCCLVSGPLFPILILPNWFRYHTMRYRFDSEGISMRWGILFRREVLLNYARIQDIHLVSNFVERWLGLARIQIQTASGSATPEMTLEGLLQFEGVRDFLYARMRGSLANRKQAAPPPLPRIGDALEGGTRSGEARRMSGMSVDEGGELAETLRSIAMDMRAIREALEKRGGQ